MDYNFSEDLEKASIAWLQQITPPDKQPKKLLDLQNGVIFIYILQTIDQEIFNQQQLIKPIENSDWALIHKNLNILLQSLELYYSKILQRPFDINYIDVLQISKNNDSKEILKLIEIIIFVVVQSAKKEQYIGAILNLDQQYQTTLMHIIAKHLESGNQSVSYQDEDTQVNKLLQKLKEFEIENEKLKEQFELGQKEFKYLQLKYQEAQEEIQQKSDDIRELRRNRSSNIRDSFLTNLGFETNDELETQFKLKDKLINKLQEEKDQLKKIYDEQIKQIIDENEKLMKGQQNLKLLEDLAKQQREQLDSLNAKNQDLIKENQQLSIALEDSKHKQSQNNIQFQDQKQKIKELKESILDQKYKIEQKDSEISLLKIDQELMTKKLNSISDRSSMYGGVPLNRMSSIWQENQSSFYQDETSEKSPNKQQNLQEDFIETIEQISRQSQMQKLQQENNQPKADTNQQNDEQIETYIFQLKDLKNQLDILSKENEQLRNIIQETQKDNQNQTTENEQLKFELKQQVIQHQFSVEQGNLLEQSQTMLKLQIENESLSKLSQSSQEQLKQIQDKYNSLFSNQQQYQKQDNEKCKLIQNLEDQIDQLKNENLTISNEYDKLEDLFTIESQRMEEQLQLLMAANNDIVFKYQEQKNQNSYLLNSKQQAQKYNNQIKNFNQSIPPEQVKQIIRNL